MDNFMVTRERGSFLRSVLGVSRKTLESSPFKRRLELELELEEDELSTLRGRAPL